MWIKDFDFKSVVISEMSNNDLMNWLTLSQEMQYGRLIKAITSEMNRRSANE